MHKPIFTESSSSDKLVVFIHGFMGSPDQFEDLAEIARGAGFSCLSLLLPGHGVPFGEFVKCKAEDWELHVLEEIKRVRDNYSEIFLAGHSMGGLLALAASLDPENKIAGVFMLSTPMKINILRPKPLLSRLRLIMYPRAHSVKSAYIKSNSVTDFGASLAPAMLGAILCFYRIMRKTKGILKDVTVPVVMIHSGNDETVSTQSAKILYDGLTGARRESMMISESWHAYYPDGEREIIRDKFQEFIMGRRSP